MSFWHDNWYSFGLLSSLNPIDTSNDLPELREVFMEVHGAEPLNQTFKHDQNITYRS